MESTLCEDDVGSEERSNEPSMDLCLAGQKSAIVGIAEAAQEQGGGLNTVVKTLVTNTSLHLTRRSLITCSVNHSLSRC
jgi:hypothetical protein